MNYWHLQMNQPWGRNNGFIDSREMLKKKSPVIGTGEWDDTQCYYFKGVDQRGIKLNDIVLIHEGKKPIALCKIIGENFTDPELTEEFDHVNFRHVEVLAFFNGENNFPQPVGTLERLVNKNTDTFKYIKNYHDQVINNMKMKELSEILLSKKQIILQGPPGTGKTFTAKNLAEYIIFGSVSTDKKNQQKNLEESQQFKLVQFHPSYSYEDFVRGITAKSDGKTIEYTTENKVFAEFASLANQNWQSAHDPSKLSHENWLRDSIDEFKEYLLNNFEKDDERLFITQKAYISRVTENSIRYNADSWGDNDGGVPISDLIKMYNANVKTRKDIKELTILTKTAKSLSTYWLKILELFRKFISDNNLQSENVQLHQTEKKYVLIIDEINRANLPTVLGELIYALEYRGSEVESMYAVEGEYKFSIPDNLLIIATMNTADRSVGHIDYAIRRRFAFINVQSDISVIQNHKAKEIFNKVAELFNSEFIAPDFDAQDIQIGHSYFLANSDNELKLKLKFEIVPILKEYLKDGILLEKAKYKINEIEQFSL